MGKSTDPQAHTDKYTMLAALDPDTGEIKTLELGDDTITGLHILQWVWDTNTLAWVKMEQPVIEAGDLYVAVDDLEQYTLDQLLQYKLARFDATGDPIYVGYLDKGGNYYIKRITLSTGVVDYSAGTSGFSTAWTNRATESYNDFDTEF
jgi:hypothetical protein